MADALRAFVIPDALYALSDDAATMLAKLLDEFPARAVMISPNYYLNYQAKRVIWWKTVLHVQSVLKEIWPDLPVTFDLLDRRDGDYHQGLHFAIFSDGLRGEIARGGAYQTGYGEDATGLSIYMERVLRALPQTEKITKDICGRHSGTCHSDGACGTWPACCDGKPKC